MLLLVRHTHKDTLVYLIDHGLRLAGLSEQLGEMSETQFWRSKLRVSPREESSPYRRKASFPFLMVSSDGEELLVRSQAP